jgi:hypothetical protein
MATKESGLTGLEPGSFQGHFEKLTRIATVRTRSSFK